MDPLWAALAGSLATLVIGGALFLRLGRRARGSGPPPPGAGEMGYGAQRWQRELALWRGTLRRLEIQARHASPPSERLLAEIAEARQRIAEAERHASD